MNMKKFTNVQLQMMVERFEVQKENNLESMQRIYQILLKENNSIKQLVLYIKNIFVTKKESSILNNYLDLIVFLIVNRLKIFINEINSTIFLNSIYQCLNDKFIEEEIKLLILQLFVFLNQFFEKENDIYNNFQIMHKKIQNNFQNIPQVQQKWLDFQQVVLNQALNQKNKKDYLDLTNLSQKGQKLYQDLQVVIQQMETCNSLIDQKQIQNEEKFQELENMKLKLLKLPNQLVQAQEHALNEYVLRIIQDIQQTFQRLQKQKDGLNSQHFKSSFSSLNEIDQEDLKKQISIKKQQSRSKQNIDDNQDIFNEFKEDNQQATKIINFEQMIQFEEISKEIIKLENNIQINDNVDPFDFFDKQNLQEVQQQQLNTAQNITQGNQIQNQQININDFKDPFESIVDNHLFKVKEEKEQQKDTTNFFITQESIKEIQQEQLQENETENQQIEKNADQENQQKEFDPFEEFK